MSEHVGIYRIEISLTRGRPTVEAADVTKQQIIDSHTAGKEWDGKSQNYSGCWVRWEDYEKLRKQVNADE